MAAEAADLRRQLGQVASAYDNTASLDALIAIASRLVRQWAGDASFARIQQQAGPVYDQAVIEVAANVYQRSKARGGSASYGSAGEAVQQFYPVDVLRPARDYLSIYLGGGFA